MSSPCGSPCLCCVSITRWCSPKGFLGKRLEGYLVCWSYSLIQVTGTHVCLINVIVLLLSKCVLSLSPLLVGHACLSVLACLSPKKAAVCTERQVVDLFGYAGCPTYSLFYRTACRSSCTRAQNHSLADGHSFLLLKIWSLP